MNNIVKLKTIQNNKYNICQMINKILQKMIIVQYKIIKQNNLMTLNMNK